MSENRYTLPIPAKVENLNTIRGFIKGHAKRASIPQNVIDAVVLSVDEAATNIIRHGYEENGLSGNIEVEVIVLGNGLSVCLRDNAPPFDPTTLPDPDLTLPLELRPIGGLGVFIMRKKTDRLTYRLNSQGQNEITLTKYI